MNDQMIVAILAVVVYAIYMTVGPGGDGVIFGSLIGFLGLCAGIKVGSALEQKKAVQQMSEPGIVDSDD